MIQTIFDELKFNHLFHITILAWMIAQTIKVALGIIRTKKFDFRWFIGTGGMPSAHAAGASALAVTSGFDYGFNSGIFALAAVFAMVTMFDAQGVRRSAGTQARILNKITEDIYWQGRVPDTRLKELIGHTPVEVIVGSIIGILIAIILQK
ncbi:MAG: divergent PAP2 family protein [Candidatus Omnitrophica bacterium]|nr:divergent PAP2 family protein [Candidatus Omnitrophota bacterium]MDD5355356.1 divergent PAP2 family protein [Candidatus Omnitrophota bacterium]